MIFLVPMGTDPGTPRPGRAAVLHSLGKGVGVVALWHVFLAPIFGMRGDVIVASLVIEVDRRL